MKFNKICFTFLIFTVFCITSCEYSDKDKIDASQMSEITVLNDIIISETSEITTLNDVIINENIINEISSDDINSYMSNNLKSNKKLLSEYCDDRWVYEADYGFFKDTEEDEFIDFGTQLEIEYNENNDLIIYISTVSVEYKLAKIEAELNMIDDKNGEFLFDDNWGNIGKGKIYFENDKIIKINFEMTTEEKENNYNSYWGIFRGDFEDEKVFYREKDIQNPAYYDKNEELILSKEGNNINDFIPFGWKLLSSAEGDLNKDSKNDFVAVIENASKSSRVLFTAFNTDGVYKLSVQSNKLVLKYYEGGAFGDPFESIKIDRGSIVLKLFGGSNEKWYYNFRFRFQDNGWYLIGATFGGGNAEKGEEYDCNLLTGRTNHTAYGETEIKETINSGKKDLIKLDDSNIDRIYSLELDFKIN